MAPKQGDLAVIISFFIREEYFTMKKQWETMSQVQIKRFSEFASRRQLVGKSYNEGAERFLTV